MGSGSGFCDSPIYVFDVRVLYEEGGGGLHDHFSGSQCARHRGAPGRCSCSQAAWSHALGPRMRSGDDSAARLRDARALAAASAARRASRSRPRRAQTARVATMSSSWTLAACALRAFSARRVAARSRAGVRSGGRGDGAGDRGRGARPDLVAALSKNQTRPTREKTPSRARVVSSAPKGDVYSAMHKLRAVRAKFQILDEKNNLQTSYL